MDLQNVHSAYRIDWSEQKRQPVEIWKINISVPEIVGGWPEVATGNDFTSTQSAPGARLFRTSKYSQHDMYLLATIARFKQWQSVLPTLNGMWYVPLLWSAMVAILHNTSHLRVPAEALSLRQDGDFGTTMFAGYDSNVITSHSIEGRRSGRCIRLVMFQ